jgi:hypothetical protein
MPVSSEPASSFDGAFGCPFGIGSWSLSERHKCSEAPFAAGEAVRNILPGIGISLSPEGEDCPVANAGSRPMVWRYLFGYHADVGRDVCMALKSGPLQEEERRSPIMAGEEKDMMRDLSGESLKIFLIEVFILSVLALVLGWLGI